MSVTVRLTVEEISTMLEVFTSVQLERAASVGGSYSLVTTITLVAGTYYYSYEDSAGSASSWYRYRFYNATGPVASDYCNPFQPDAVTRKKIRQEGIEHYEQGMVLSSAEGGSESSIITSDYRFAASLYRADRAKGGWVKVTSGGNAGSIVRVTGSSVSGLLGTFTVSPALGVPCSEGDEFEWHWVTDPARWDRAINDGLARYYYLDRVPVVGTGESEISLANFPWLKKAEDAFGLWFYPLATTVGDIVGFDQEWVGSGRWWGVRGDAGALVLRAIPAPDTSVTLYLEAARAMAPLFTDDSLAVRDCHLDTAAALAYDEVLAALSRPGTGASKDVDAFQKERLLHTQGELKGLLERDQLKPRGMPPQTPEPARTWQPWSAR